MHMHSLTHACIHIHKRKSEWHACVHVHIHTQAHECTYIHGRHTCTAATSHFSAAVLVHAHAQEQQHTREHACTYTVWHSTEDLPQVQLHAAHSQGRTLSLHVLISFFDWEQNERVLVATEFALWDSVTFTWGKQLIFWVKDEQSRSFVLVRQGCVERFVVWRQEFVAWKGCFHWKFALFCVL